MKKIIFSSILLFLFASTLSAQTVDEVIDKHIAALGGKEKLKSVKSVRMTLKGRAQGFEFPVEMVSKKNSGVKTVTTIQGMKMIQCYDENTKSGWAVNPMMGDKKAQKMNEEQTKQAQEQGGKMESDLLDYKEKGHTAEYLGKEDLDGEEVYLIKLNKKDGSITYYYIDVITNLTIKEKTKQKLKDKEFEGESWFSNYQTVDGITSPGTVESYNNGILGFEITMEKIEYNIEIDDAIFKMPDPNANNLEQNKEK
ncbi:MAG: hypothetical protein IAF38_12000 [Bacteroidia bacterium]|nr:hypothetical protein [Bacteroidia bacterium]